MRRREFFGLVGGAAVAWPLATRAQEPVRRVGVLANVFENDAEMQASLKIFREELARLGWSEGRNVRIDIRFTQADLSRVSQLATEMVALQPDVMLVHTTPFVAAAQKATRTIPIVFINASDPVGSGFIPSLARPGGNLTGLQMYEATIVGKWLSMLKEIAPQTTRVAFVANPTVGTVYQYFLRTAETAARSLAIELVPSPVETRADIERVITSLAHTPNCGLLFPPNATNTAHRELIIALAAKHRLPAVYPYRFFATAGGLMSYGIDQVDVLRRAATYVDRILKGEKPADLPVQAPTKFETVVNLKTAKAIGLTVPPGILVGADEVIE